MPIAPVTFPTAADIAGATDATNGEVYGLRTTLMSGESNYNAPDIFIHGRDYDIAMPASPQMASSPDQSQYVRVYRLRADNIFSGSTMIKRAPWCSAERLYLFMASLLGYPYMATDTSRNLSMFRHLPEPYYAGSQNRGPAGANTWAGNAGQAYTWVDTRDGGSGVLRYSLHASRVISVRGVAPGGESPVTVGATWDANIQSCIWTPSNPSVFAPPDEAYPQYEVTVLFERLPYMVMKWTDPDYLGEFSRFVIYQEDPVGRALQVRAGVKWDSSATGYGQPGTSGLPGTPVSGTISAQEGAPVYIGENNLTWRWVDVHPQGVNWNSYKTFTGPPMTNRAYGVCAYFGVINSIDFCTQATSPYRLYTKESLLFRSAGRSTDKPCCIGVPLNDYTLFYEQAPSPDGFGYWNRLLNKNGQFQRYLTGTTNFYRTIDFKFLFSSPAYWP
jgi:hypothetical protein